MDEIRIVELGRFCSEFSMFPDSTPYRAYLPGNAGTLLEVYSITSVGKSEYIVTFVCLGSERVTYRQPLIIVARSYKQA